MPEYGDETQRQKSGKRKRHTQSVAWPLNAAKYLVNCYSSAHDVIDRWLALVLLLHHELHPALCIVYVDCRIREEHQTTLLPRFVEVDRHAWVLGLAATEGRAFDLILHSSGASSIRLHLRNHSMAIQQEWWWPRTLCPEQVKSAAIFVDTWELRSIEDRHHISDRPVLCL